MGISTRLWYWLSTSKLNPAANFIHGTDGNPLVDIVKKAGSTVIHSILLRKYYDADGKELSKETTKLINRKVWEYYKAAMNYSRENEVHKDETVEDFCNNRLENDQEVNDEDIKKSLHSRLKMIAEIAACDLDKMSLKYFWMEDDLPVH